MVVAKCQLLAKFTAGKSGNCWLKFWLAIPWQSTTSTSVVTHLEAFNIQCYCLMGKT